MPMSGSKSQRYGPNSSELRAFGQLALERSSDKRQELMARLTDFLNVDTYPTETVTIHGETLITLLDQIDENGRVELSQSVAPQPITPHKLAKRLAQDTSVGVGEPVLAQSPVLNDDDLVEIAGAQSEGHFLAMSKRPSLSSEVTNAIIDNGTAPVFRAVVRNKGAEISENGFVRLSSHAPATEGLAEALSKRTDIPEAVVYRVITGFPPDYRSRLEALWHKR